MSRNFNPTEIFQLSEKENSTLNSNDATTFALETTTTTTQTNLETESTTMIAENTSSGPFSNYAKDRSIFIRI